MSRYSLKFLTIVCVLRLPAVGRPEIWRLRAKQSRNVKIKSDAELLLIVPWTSQVTIYESKLFEWRRWPLQDSCLPLRHSGAHDCLASPIKIFFIIRAGKIQNSQLLKLFTPLQHPRGLLFMEKYCRKTIKEWQLGSKQSENRTISRQAKNRQDRFCIWQKTPNHL